VCSGVYQSSIVTPFKTGFPEETFFCEPTALYSAGDAPTVASKVLAIGFLRQTGSFSRRGNRLL
jgi:hypothetical protein